MGCDTHQCTRAHTRALLSVATAATSKVALKFGEGLLDKVLSINCKMRGAFDDLSKCSSANLRAALEWGQRCGYKQGGATY